MIVIGQKLIMLSNMDIDKKYLALDLELNNAPDGSTPNPKIIQVGVAWGSIADGLVGNIKTAKWYINPGDPIFPYITQLTGITNDDISRYSVSHETVAEELSEIIESNDMFVNPITWGGGDSSALLSEFRYRGVAFPHFGRRWVDIKTWYIYNRLSVGASAAGGLSKSMPKFGIHFKGTPHRADEDAFNTLRLFFAMIERQNKMETIVRLAKGVV